MAIVVQEEGSIPIPIPIPEDLAREFGIHKGSAVEWERTEDGTLKLRLESTRSEAARRLSGMGRAWLKPGESGVEAFLKERQEERELDDSYNQG